MQDLHELYQELILDHSRAPRNFGALPGANREAKGYNPLCGDQVMVYAVVTKGRIETLRFEGVGCAISTASASLMTEILQGKTEQEAKALFTAFHAMVTGKAQASADLDKLAALAGVRQFPMRVKCATLCWHTLDAALKQLINEVTTER